MDLAQGAIGTEGMYDLKVAGGKLVLSAAHNAKASAAKVEVSVEVDYFLDKLAAQIPGTIDDAVLGLIKGALKAL